MSINLKWQSGYYGTAGRNLRSGSNTRNALAQASVLLPAAASTEEPTIHEAAVPGQAYVSDLNRTNSARH